MLLLLPMLSAFILLRGSPSETLVLVAAFFLGFAAGAESGIVAFMAARYFEMREYGRIYGMLYMPLCISSISPLL